MEKYRQNDAGLDELIRSIDHIISSETDSSDNDELKRMLSLNHYLSKLNSGSVTRNETDGNIIRDLHDAASFRKYLKDKIPNMVFFGAVWGFIGSQMDNRISVCVIGSIGFCSILFCIAEYLKWLKRGEKERNINLFLSCLGGFAGVSITLLLYENAVIRIFQQNAIPFGELAASYILISIGGGLSFQRLIRSVSIIKSVCSGIIGGWILSSIGTFLIAAELSRTAGMVIRITGGILVGVSLARDEDTKSRIMSCSQVYMKYSERIKEVMS